jgi:hypothetical protein
LGLEELLELHFSASDAASSSNTALAESQDEEKRKAENLRKASLGMLSSKELSDLRNENRRKKIPHCVSPPPIK